MEGINVCKKSSKLGKKDDLYHVIHKVPYGDSPYVKAKHAQVYMLNYPFQFGFTFLFIWYLKYRFVPIHK